MKWRSLEESTPGTDTRSLRDIFAERKEIGAAIFNIAKGYIACFSETAGLLQFLDLRGS